jgi:methyltransferase (TIGR00027 family)
VGLTQASNTAHFTALARAVHLLLDGEPKILSDPLAVGFVPGSSESDIRARADEFTSPFRSRTRAGVLIRSRFTEDQLSEAVADGVRQYLILGAGFDTFAYRQPTWASELKIIEVDHPTTQAVKHQYLSQAGIMPGENVAFRAIDFEDTSLVEGLSHSSFDPHIPTFISWLGVTMYLTRPAIEATLRFVLSLPSPSRIVLTFFSPPATIADPAVREQTESVIALAEEYGEPMVSLFEPSELEEWLLKLGFSSAHHLSLEEASTRYFTDRTDGLPAASAGQNICAYV